MSTSDNKQYNRDFIYSAPHKVLFHKSITLLQLRIYSIIRSFMDTTGEAYPSNNWIATQCCGVDRTSVIRAINKLVSYGFVQRIVIDGQRYLGIVTTPLPINVIASDLNATPPSDLNATQLDQNNIITKDINNIVDSKKSTRKRPLKEYEKDTRFMRFYTTYPKKEKPHDAWKAFKSIVGDDDDLLDEIVKGIEERKKRHTQWSDPKFIIFPAAYLRSGAFEGEIFNENEAKKAKDEATALAKQQDEEKRALASQRAADAERENNRNKQADAKSFQSIRNEAEKREPSNPRRFKDIMKQYGS